MWEFHHSLDLQAPQETVFELLSNTANYGRWNPFVTSAHGPVELGGVIRGWARLGWVKAPYRHRIYELLPPQSLSWMDFGGAAILVCGNRRRQIHSTPQGCRYECHLTISGPLSGLVKVLFGKGLRDGIVAEAQAIRRLAESR